MFDHSIQTSFTLCILDGSTVQSGLVLLGMLITQAQALKNLSAVLEAAGSSIDNVVKVNVFLTNMQDFAAMNKIYDRVFHKEPKPVRLYHVSWRGRPKG